ncbi:MAG: HAD hydrolase-like protein, partial [Alphaproteobacteria bacterium]|nr:HAD hydrolase-like protein [Alphaproteobacteria bacterium]
AEIYEQQGGEVIWVGKPFPPIYDKALHRIAELSGLAKPRVLAAGDGYTTDILGANKAGLDIIFVTGGLAASELGHTQTSQKLTPQAVTQFLQSHNAHATYFTQSLIWSQN